MNEELNKELCQLLGICWHSLSRYAAVDDDDGNGCVCGKCERSFPLMNSYDPLHGNPDFISNSVALLRKMMKRKDSYGFFVDYLLGDTDVLAIAARDFLKQQKEGINGP